MCAGHPGRNPWHVEKCRGTGARQECAHLVEIAQRLLLARDTVATEFSPRKNKFEKFWREMKLWRTLLGVLSEEKNNVREKNSDGAV